jgi:hypothetical protein
MHREHQRQITASMAVDFNGLTRSAASRRRPLRMQANPSTRTTDKGQLRARVRRRRPLASMTKCRPPSPVWPVVDAKDQPEVILLTLVLPQCNRAASPSKRVSGSLLRGNSPLQDLMRGSRCSTTKTTG